MPRNVRTARGDVVDFDAIQIKQSLAQAPMNIDVERRKKFIDSKEGKGRGTRKPAPDAGPPKPITPEVPAAPLAVAKEVVETPKVEPKHVKKD